MACALVALFTALNLCGVRWVSLFAIPIAAASAALAFASVILPILSGRVRWEQAIDFHLTTPFPGWFGAVTSLMAGLYLVGFGAPAFEAATCHVGETIDPTRNVPRAVLASAGMAAVYFAAIPLIWLGTLGSEALGQDLANVLGPTFAPLFGAGAKAAAIGFMMFNMLHGTIQPLAGAARTLSQLSEDGLLPRLLAWRTSTDAPWCATLLTAGFAILFLLIGDPIWLIAAANFTYLIGIGLPSVAVWLLRMDAPDAVRPYRAPRGTIVLGLVSAAVWACSALLGFQQFGLPTVVFGLLMAYSGAGLYAWRKLEDRWAAGLGGMGHSLHVKLTGAMLLVLALDATGYFLAVSAIPRGDEGFVVALEDIFVAVALLTISVGIVLPGMIAHSADQVSEAAQRLASGTVRDFTRAMHALGAGDLDAAHASIDIVPVTIHSRDELGAMAASFNALQQGVKRAALGLDRAREGLSTARSELVRAKEAALRDALHDPLTGLPNRTLFIECLEAALARHGRWPTGKWAVLFLDLDGFKVVNDSLGHMAGNELLIQVADRLRAAIGMYERSLENAAKPLGATLARLGGDEFTILLGNLPQSSGARAVANLIQDALVPPFAISGEDIYTTASIGISLSHAGFSTSEEVLRSADLAMYRAKKLGKGRAEVYDSSMHAAAKKRLHLENDLRRALQNDEFVLHYQPIVALRTEEIVGLEALVRWQVSDGDLVYPGDFITTAEETGIIVPLGIWVLGEACRQAKNWDEQFGHRSRLTMSVNLSPRQFAQRDIAESVEAILIETGVDPALIKLEITESGTMGAPERAIRVLARLKGSVSN